MTFTEYADEANNAANSGSSATMTGNKPSGAVENDVCIAFLFTDSSSSSISAAPSGWALLESDPGGAGSDMSGWVYWKKLGAGEGASWDWTLAATAGWHVLVQNVILANLTSPIIDSNVAEENAVDNSLAITSAALDGAALVLVCGAVDASGAARTWTTGGTEGELYDAMLQQLHVGLFRVGVGETLIGDTVTSGPLIVTGSNQYMIVFQVCIRGRIHKMLGVVFGTSGSSNTAEMAVLYDPGTNAAKYLEFINEYPTTLVLEYSVTDGTTTWSGTVSDAPIGSEGDVDISAGNITVDFNIATDEFDTTNLGITYLRLNP